MSVIFLGSATLTPVASRASSPKSLRKASAGVSPLRLFRLSESIWEKGPSASSWLKLSRLSPFLYA